jgi:hypothetical protein
MNASACLSLETLQPGFQYGADDDGENDLDRIAGKIGEYTDGESRCKRRLHLESEPRRTEGIGNEGCENHSDNNNKTFVREPLDEDPCKYGHEDKSEKISPGRSGDLAKPSGKPGEYRQADGAQQQIYEITDGSVLPPEYVDADQQNQIRKRDRNRAYRDRNGERSQDTGNSGDQCDQDQTPCGQAACCSIFHGIVDFLS